MLHVVGGLHSAEIAELVDRSPGAVRVLAHRGLKRLAGTVGARTVPPPEQASAQAAVEGGVTR